MNSISTNNSNYEECIDLLGKLQISEACQKAGMKDKDRTELMISLTPVKYSEEEIEKEQFYINAYKNLPEIQSKLIRDFNRNQNGEFTDEALEIVRCRLLFPRVLQELVLSYIPMEEQLVGPDNYHGKAIDCMLSTWKETDSKRAGFLQIAHTIHCLDFSEAVRGSKNTLHVTNDDLTLIGLNCHNLTRLNLSSCSGYKTVGLASLAQLSLLHTLNINRVSLKNWNLPDNHPDNQHRITETLIGYPALRNLSIEYVNIGDVTDTEITALIQHNKNLERLNLCLTGIGNQALQAIEGVHQLKELNILQSKSKITHDQLVRTISTHAKSLESLSFELDSIDAMQRLGTLPNLTSLILWSSNIAQMLPLIKEQCPKLKVLKVAAPIRTAERYWPREEDILLFQNHPSLTKFTLDLQGRITASKINYVKTLQTSCRELSIFSVK